MSDRTKLVELDKKIEMLQSRITLLEKYVQVDDYGFRIKIGESLIYISENQVNIKSQGELKIESKESTVIESSATMNLESSADMWLMGPMIHIN